MTELVYLGSVTTVLLTIYGAHKSQKQNEAERYALLSIGILAILLAAASSMR